MSTEAIAWRSVHHRYGKTVALRDLNLAVAPGELFGLIGPDGAGKTTALRIALGLLAPTGGEVTTCGLSPRRQRRLLAGRVGYLSQRFSLYGDLSVDENFAFFAAVHGVRGWRPRRDELLDLVRLTPFRQRRADRLSGGMKQKLALACTLAHRPQLLVLDEPTTGVDPVSRRDFWNLLTRLRDDGITVVTTTPYLDEAERCHRVALLDHGTVLAVDAPRKLPDRWSGSLLEVLARPRRAVAAQLRQRREVGSVESFGERLHAALPEVPRQEASIFADRLAEELRQSGLQVETCRPIVPTLEDVFIAEIRRAEQPVPSPAEVDP